MPSRCATYVLIGLLGAVPFGVAAAIASQPLPIVERALAGRPCHNEVMRQLRAWNATGPVLVAAPGSDGTRHLRIPMDSRGDWILLDVPPNASPVVTKLHKGRWSRWSLDAQCRGSEKEILQRAVGSVQEDWPAPLTDSRLNRLLIDAELDGSGFDGSVVYVWSPHMPLSVEGYREIKQACRDLRLQLIPVLFSHSDLAFAREQAVSGGIPEIGLQELQSYELVFRDAQLHAPTIVFFSRDRVAPPLPGYRNASGYRDFLEAFLEGQ